MLGNAIDSLISIFSPTWGLERVASRNYLSRLQAVAGQHESMRKMIGSGRNAGYEAGKTDRLKQAGGGSVHENDLPRDQIRNTRWRSWKLYRNNPQARKICRTLGAKVIGRGLSPQPQTTLPDGQPFVDFRRRARHVWEEFAKEADYRGKPGRGGQHLVSLSKTALKQIILSGGVLFRFRHLDREQQKALGLFVPLTIQLIPVDRLDENRHGGNCFYGVELDAEGKVAAYWILKGEAIDAKGPVGADRSVRMPATEMGHLFSEEDIDQVLGSPWFGAALLTADDRRNYEYSELIAAEMGACIVAGYRRSGGQTGGPGLGMPDANRDLTDAQGNRVEYLQPGMFLDLGQNGELQMVSPNRPNNGAGEFISHLVRSEAVSMPGVKSSTLTGDYRNSSFSSERSADNDIWPEIEEIQDWFSCGFCQSVYDEVITTAVAAGLFAEVKGFTVADFNDRKRDYLKTNWQGPVPRSINPVDDADASRQRVKNANSSPQREAAQIGRDWREILQEDAEFIEFAKQLDIPQDIWQQALGIEQRDAAPAGSPRPTEQQQDDAMAALRRRAAAVAAPSGFAALNSVTPGAAP